MSNIKEREKFDDYEMLDEYDFSDGILGGLWQRGRDSKKPR
ncbi:MAG: hypothetical protein U9R50_12915 [Campylobacterota bacterium]|nr:hypothetical protein [Campylobacterota bacterium]